MKNLYFQFVATLFTILCFFISNLNAQEITATMDENDAFIDISWAIPTAPCNIPTNTTIDLELLGNGVLVHLVDIDNPASLGDTIFDSFVHQIGPNATINYVVRLVENQGGTVLCSYNTQGATLPFQQISNMVASDANRPDSIYISWTNNSSLADLFNIYRDGEFLTTVPGGALGQQFAITDAHNPNDTTTIQEGQTYNYCVETFSNIQSQAYGNACETGSTFDIILNASDGTPTDKVSITWSNLSTFGDRVKILRNGIQITTLPTTTSTFDDLSPIFGLSSSYSMILVKNDTELLIVDDPGAVPKNGSISGSVLTRAGYYPVQNVQVDLKIDTTIGGSPTQVVVQSEITDSDGRFQFADVYYHIEKDFIIEALKSGNLFEEPTLEVNLSRADAAREGITFFEATGYEDSGIPHNISSFSAIPNGPQDKMDLAWSYTQNPSKTSYFNIFRGSDQIARLNDEQGMIDSYTDLDGIPGQSYLYTISAYHISDLNDEVTAKSLADETIFPVVASESNLSASPDPTKGIIQLNWGPSHTSVNHNGFRVFRNEVQIAELPIDEFSFDDYEAPPGVSVEYSVASYRTAEGIDHESAKYPIPFQIATMPQLPQPEQFMVTGIPASDIVRISWTVPSELTNNYNYEGFYIYRKEAGMTEFQVIGKQYKNFTPPGQSINFDDKNGKPDISYTYKIGTILKTPENTYAQFSNEIVQIYPSVLPPSNVLVGSDVGKVSFNWDAHTSINHAGYEIFRDGNSIDILSVGDKDYDDYVNNPPVVSANYELNSFRIVANDTFYSIPFAATIGPDAPSNAEELPQDFTASTDIANHIKLCWLYNKSKVSDFVLSRNGVPIDTIPSSQGIPFDLVESFTFYDYGAPDMEDVEYTIYAIHMGVASDIVRAVGNQRSFRKISGRIAKDISGQGVPGATIIVQDATVGSLFFDQVATDSSGYYEFINVPLILSDSLIIEVLGENSDFDSGPSVVKSDSQKIQLEVGMNEYEVNFTDYFEMYEGNEIASPFGLKGISDAANMQVILGWSTTNANYSGYEVFRATSLIAVVGLGGELVVKDDNAFPGIPYDYSVRAFLDTDDGREYSPFVGVNVLFPNLEPVTNLYATHLEEENVWQIGWSHPYDMHDSYRVERNGVTVASIPSGDSTQQLIYIDSTGVPSKPYEYKITAIKGTYASEKKTVSFNYGKVDEVRNLTSSISLITGCDGQMTSQNNVEIKWDYSSTSADGFEVYRNDKMIADIENGLISEVELNGVLDTVTNTTGRIMYYKDFKGEPDQTTTYRVLPYVTREGEKFSSGFESIVETISTTFPALAPIRNLTVAPRQSSSDVLIAFDYDTAIVDGFNIFRMVDLDTSVAGQNLDTSLVTTLFAEDLSSNIMFPDAGGYPGARIYTDTAGFRTFGVLHEYTVEPFAFRENILYKGARVCSESTVYPWLEEVPVITAADAETYIDVNWTYPSNIEIDGFEIVLAPGYAFGQNPTNIIDTIDVSPGQRSCQCTPTDPNTRDGYGVNIRAFRYVDNKKYYSENNYDFILFGEILNENYTLHESGDANLGFSVAADGSFASAGAPHPGGVAEIYEWQLQNHEFTFLGADVEGAGMATNTEFGTSYDISGVYSITGSPAHFNGTGAMDIRKWNSFDGEWQLFDSFSGVENNGGFEDPGVHFGQAVAIHDNGESDSWAIVGAPDDPSICLGGNPGFQNFGRVLLFKSNSSGFSLAQEIYNPLCTFGHSYSRFGAQVAITEHDAFISFKETGGNTKFLHYQKNGSTWEFKQIFTPSFQMGDEPGSNKIDMQGDFLVIGADLENKVYIYRKNELNLYQSHGQLTGTDGFGYSVSIQEEYVVVGAPFDDEVGDDSGATYLYRNQEGNSPNWQLVEKQTSPYLSSSEGDQMGCSVDLSDIGYIVGAWNADPPLNSTGKGAVYFYHLGKVRNVEATDGVGDEVVITWNYSGPEVGVMDGFRVYRDDSSTPIQTITSTYFGSHGIEHFDTTFTDLTGIPGRRYIYNVVAFKNDIQYQTPPVYNEGWRRSNGLISGKVLAIGGQIAVPGVEIVASTDYNGETFSYTDTTNVSGEYEFPFLFYNQAQGSNTTYSVTAELNGHNITPASGLNVTLNNSSGNGPAPKPDQNFMDNTAYVISGTISRKDVDCNLQGIKVAMNNNLGPALIVETDAKGRYAFVFNPYEDGLDSMTIAVSDTLVTQDDTLVFEFHTEDQFTFNDFLSFPLLTVVDFEDTLAYPIQLSVESTCGISISSDRFFIRIRSTDGCYDQTVLTDAVGKKEVHLPPYNYTMKVIAAQNPTPTSQLAIDFFAGVPVALNLFDISRDSLLHLTPTQFDSLINRSFVYHKAPDIAVSGFQNFICNDPAKAAILKQTEEYTLQFLISEDFDGNNCNVKEGKLKITNPAATVVETELILDSGIGQFPPYVFTAGDPNQIAPHLHGMVVDYLSDDDEFLGSRVIPIFVEGSVAVPGVDVIVDPANEGQVQYPMFVLRDPPGDKSKSFIETGQTVSQKVKFTTTGESAVTAYIKGNAYSLGIGSDFSTSVTNGTQIAGGTEYTYTLTTKRKFETSSSPSQVGRKADVMIGAGLSTQYGLVHSFRVIDCDTILKEVSLGISSNNVNTTWSYTIGQIEDIIKGYRMDSIMVENGSLQISTQNRPLSKSDAIELLGTYISNWEQVIHFHDVETLPHYLMCSSEPTDIEDIFVKAEINNWQNDFCPDIGEYVDGDFVLHDEIQWTNTLVNKYNRGAIAIRNLSLTGDAQAWQYNPLDFSTAENAHSSFSNTFGPMAQNYTTGGVIPNSQSIKNVSASKHAFNFKVFAGFTVDVSFYLKNGLTIVAAPAGAGKIKTVFSNKVGAGVKGSMKFSISNNYATSVQEATTVGFTILDDDAIDQHSIFVIQGPAQNHTPYFESFGGHTSCPPEEGTIFVDDPSILILENGATFSDRTLYNVPENAPAVFSVQIGNNSPLNTMPNRDVEVFLVNGSNSNGATVKMDGDQLGSKVYSGLAPGAPIVEQLTVERGLVSYDYEDITIGIRPACGSGPVEYITLSVYFSSPCSPVTLITPDDNWVVNSNDSLLICISDYVPTNDILNEVVVEYRRIGNGSDWSPVPLPELGLMTQVDTNVLIAWNASIAEGQVPAYYFLWVIPDNASYYPDGDYEIRVVMDCGFSKTISNVVPGKLAREGLRLFGTPQPADGIWTSGDEISISFNKNLDCPLMENQAFIDENISLIDQTTGFDVPFTMVCYDNKLIFVTDDPMENYDSHILNVSVDKIQATTGATLAQPENWDFRVVTQKLFWQTADTVRVTLYENGATTLPMQIFNSTGIETVNGLALNPSDGNLDSWLSYTPNGTFSVSPAGTTADFTFNANQSVGTYSEAIDIIGIGSGVNPSIVFELTIIPEKPEWKVDISNFDESMVLVTNWRFISETQGTISIDTTDLISVWIDNEIRGVANISAVGGQFYAAYLTVFGDVSDNGKELSFRIWDASEANEYDGTPEVDDIFFQVNDIKGSSGIPEMLLVNPNKDRARYIPLNQGWTWFSINTSETNMSVDNQLRSLRDVSDGDIIKTDGKFAQYIEGHGWHTQGGESLNALNKDEGYLIYIEDASDTIRVTGFNATVDSIDLNAGWNWVGYPLQEAQLINDVLDIDPDNGNNLVKTVRQNGTSPFADFDVIFGEWNGSLTELRPNDAYKIYNGNALGAELNFNQPSSSFGGGAPLASGSGHVIADTADVNTWNIGDFNYEYVMHIVGSIKIGDDTTSDVADRIALFVGNDLRGTGFIQYTAPTDQYEVSMLVGSVTANEMFTIYHFDASENTITRVPVQITFNEDGYGSFTNPYIIDFGDCPEVLTINPGVTPVSGLYQARTEINVTGKLTIPPGGTLELSAPVINWSADQLSTLQPNQTLIIGGGCN